MAMAALNSGKRAANVVVMDNLNYTFGGRTFGSPETDRPGPKDMRAAIVSSSNVYFYSLANEMGVDLIHDQLAPFGLGRRTGIDMEGELTGDLPSTDWKRRRFKKPEQQRWYAGETISLGIGQGANNFTMLQMANAMSTLCRGLRFKPRLVHEVEDTVTRERRPISSQALEPLPGAARTDRAGPARQVRPEGVSRFRAFTRPAAARSAEEGSDGGVRANCAPAPVTRPDQAVGRHACTAANPCRRFFTQRAKVLRRDVASSDEMR